MTTSRRALLKGLTGATALSTGSLIPTWATAVVPPPGPPIPAGAIKGSTRQAAASDQTLWNKAWGNRFTNVLPNPLAATAIYAPMIAATPVTPPVYLVKATQGTADVLGIGVNTEIWGYHNQETLPTYPGRTFLVTKGTTIKVQWKNNLVGAVGPLPHILPIDQSFVLQTTPDGKAITGVPLAVHHHGGDTAAEFDGTPDQWATPLRNQTGPGIAVTSPALANAGVLTYTYDNNQEASMHWYHDHADTITGVNVGAGLAGLYMVTDANEADLRARGVIPPAVDEVALVLQDRVFGPAGNFTYATSQADSPTTLPANFTAGMPTHLPEVFGDVIVVNGKAWPAMTVQPRKYRLRLLNGADSRVFSLQFKPATVAATGAVNLPTWVIGNDLGFLNNPVLLNNTGVTIAPGERLDLIVDFGAPWFAGGIVDLMNDAQTPFPTGVAPTGLSGTANVMRFNVAQRVPFVKPTTPPLPTLAMTVDTTRVLRGTNGTAALTPIANLPVPAVTRRILLAEGLDAYSRTLPMLGIYDPTGVNNLGTLSFTDAATETPKNGTSEIWEFWNTTVDAHPVHLHLVQFRILNRQTFTGTVDPTNMSNGAIGKRLRPGAKLGATITVPGEWIRGWKDTVVCMPGEVTRILVTFNRPGKYVYHCHILSHEDHDMMRWYQVI